MGPGPARIGPGPSITPYSGWGHHGAIICLEIISWDEEPIEPIKFIYLNGFHGVGGLEKNYVKNLHEVPPHQNAFLVGAGGRVGARARQNVVECPQKILYIYI